MINAIYRTILSREQVGEVREAIRSKKLMEVLVNKCAEEYICQRDATYKAIHPETYNGEKCHHRCVLDAAVRELKLHGVQFAWNTIQYQESQYA